MNRRDSILQQDFTALEALPLPWGQLKKKCIFITGGTGFIGRYLLEFLCWINRRMSLELALVPLCRRGAAPPVLEPRVHWIEGDITEAFIPVHLHPDIVIHGASPANQRAIQSDPAGVVNCNILATRYLLEWARTDKARFLYFSSGEVYPRGPGRIVEKSAKELAQGGPLSLYGSSKLAGELLCEQYHSRYGIECRILRPFSVFGPGEPLASGRCFTDFLRQALETRRIRVEGPGTQLRSYCYLSDFVSGLLYVLLRGESTVYNMGNEDNTCSILKLAKQIAEVSGSTEVIGPLCADTGADSFIPDTTKLRRLGWRPQVDLETCIKWCLDSYR